MLFDAQLFKNVKVDKNMRTDDNMRTRDDILSQGLDWGDRSLGVEDSK